MPTTIDRQIHTIPLGVAGANSDLSDWAPLLRPLGFDTVSGDVSKLRWRNSPFGLWLNNTGLKMWDFEKAAVVNWNICANCTTTPANIMYRHLYDESILFGFSASNGTFAINSGFLQPMSTDEPSWVCFNEGGFGFSGRAGATSIWTPSNGWFNQGQITAMWPQDAIALEPIWEYDHFREKCYWTSVIPNFTSYCIFNTEIDNKKFIIVKTAAAAGYKAWAVDITEEDAEVS